MSKFQPTPQHPGVTLPGKLCSSCQISKSIIEFYNDAQTKDGIARRCKECAKQAVYASRRANIDYIKEYDRKRAQATRDAKKQLERNEIEREKRLIEETNTDFLN